MTESFRQLLLIAPHTLENYFAIYDRDTQVAFLAAVESWEGNEVSSFNHYNTANNMTDGFCRRLLQSPEEVVLFFRFRSTKSQNNFINSIKLSLQNRSSLSGAAAKVLLINFFDDELDAMNRLA